MMKTEGNNPPNVIWATSVELPQLTHDECLPVIGNCQISSLLSNLDASEKNLQTCLEIPQSMELIVLQNKDFKLSSLQESTSVKNVVSNVPIDTEPLHDNAKKKFKTIKAKEPFNDATYFFCDLCPFLSVKESRLADHILSVHKNGNMLKLTKLKCPACANIFYHRVSLRSHLIYDHMVSNSDLSKIMQLSHSKKKFSERNSEPAVKHVHKTLNDSSSYLNCKNEFDLKYIDKLNKLTSEKILNDDVHDSPELIAIANDVISEVNIEDATVKDGNHSSTMVNLPTVDISCNNAEKMFNSFIKKQNTLSKFLDNKKQHKCNVAACKVRLQSIDKINYHIKCHVDSSFTCPECGEVFLFWKPLLGHLWRSHKVDMELYSCDKCDYKTFSLGKLNNIHKLIHGDAKSFTCDICPKAFKNSKQLRNHKTAHKEKNGSTIYYCDICTKAFSVKRQLRIHTDGVHKKLKPYLCNFCGYKGASKSALRMHIRQHTGEKPFACDTCSYTTADHNSLRRHKLRHTGEKPYKCTQCNYACIQSSTYKVHLKTKHPELEKDLLFSCPDCSFRSINKDMFNAHFTSVHKQKI